MSRDAYNERWQPGESLLCSPKDTPASQEWGAVALWAGPLPLQGWGHTHCGEPSPCPGLLWDTGQCKPFPSPILASFPHNLPLPRLRAHCPPGSYRLAVPWEHLIPEGLLLGRFTTVKHSCAAGLLSSLHPGRFFWEAERQRQRGEGNKPSWSPFSVPSPGQGTWLPITHTLQTGKLRLGASR